MRAAEIAGALEALLEAHHGFNNFHTEPALALSLERLVGEHGAIPDALAPRYPSVLVEVFLTNGHGVAWSADSTYRRLIERLDPTQAAVALRTFTDPTIASRLQYSLPGKQWSELLDLLEPKFTRRSDRELLSAVRVFNGTPDVLGKAADIRRLLGAGQAHRHTQS